MNSLRHGLRIETLALPGESGETLRAQLDEWNDYYRPTSPGERTLITMAVTASIQQQRSLEYQTSTVSDLVRSAEKRWDEAREDEVKRLIKLLPTDPAEAVLVLKRTGHGCRWLISRWERLLALLDDPAATYAAADRDEVIRLQGLDIDPDCLGAATETRLTWRVVMTLYPGILAEERRHTPRDIREGLLEMWREEQREKERERKGIPKPPDDQSWADDPARGRAWLRDRIVAHLEPLRQREAILREVHDTPEREGAAKRAQLLEGPAGANWLRYERMHQSTFFRAYSTFVKGREQAVKTGRDPGAPDEATDADDQNVNQTVENTCRKTTPASRFSDEEVSSRPRLFRRALAPNEANGGPGASLTSSGALNNVGQPGAVPAADPAAPGATRALAVASGPPPASDT